LMRLFDDYIKRRPLMERDGSGVSALLGLDGLTQRGVAVAGSEGLASSPSRRTSGNRIVLRRQWAWASQ
jgi:hypothetical protein